MPFQVYMIQVNILLLLVSAVNGINFTCRNETESHTLRYENSSKPIDILPTVRLFQGYYGSQWAMQYAAYVYLTEQLGVNVSWFPSSEHYVFYEEDFNVNGSSWYPEYYFKWISQDESDLLFEIWPGAMEVAR